MISPEGKTNIKIRNFKRDRKWMEQSIRRDGQSEIFSLTLIHKTTQVAKMICLKFKIQNAKQPYLNILVFRRISILSPI